MYIHDKECEKERKEERERERKVAEESKHSVTCPMNKKNNSVLAGLPLM